MHYSIPIFIEDFQMFPKNMIFFSDTVESNRFIESNHFCWLFI